MFKGLLIGAAATLAWIAVPAVVCTGIALAIGSLTKEESKEA